METKVLVEQCWAYTNKNNQVGDYDYTRDYYGWESGAIDAPEYIASGSTIENMVRFSRSNEPAERYVIGGLARRY